MTKEQLDVICISLFNLFLIIVNVCIIVHTVNQRDKFEEDLKSTEQQLSYCQQDMDDKMMEVEFIWFMPEECEWALLTEECLCE